MQKKLDALYYSKIKSLDFIARGKVRDIYSIDEQYMLIVTSDRLSAFDVVLPDSIPGKGQVLTEISNFWFRMFKDMLPNHLTDISLRDIVTDKMELKQLESRSIVVKKLQALPIEAVVRGYLIGSAWEDYKENKAVCGISLPTGLLKAEKLPEPIFTPASKAKEGEHDENIGFEKMSAIIGTKLAEQIRDISLRIYVKAAKYAKSRGIIIADTKLEFGVDDIGNLVLIDEILTPDSSRFWPIEHYKLGTSPPSFDKQYVRDYLETLNWDRTSPGPKLPDKIIQNTSSKYKEAKESLIK